MEVCKFYEIQKYMTMTRHVYSSHIDVVGLKWWNSLSAYSQAHIAGAIKDAAIFQRADNRAKDAGRMALLGKKGMIIEDHPDVAAFRARVADLKNMDLYSDPRVNALLIKMIEATR